MLNIKLAPEDSQSMAQDGYSILRSLQNKSLPMVDLLVRESIQNSLDATITGQDIRYTLVDYTVGDFDSREFSSLFELVGSKIHQRCQCFMPPIKYIIPFGRTRISPSFCRVRLQIHSRTH